MIVKPGTKKLLSRHERIDDFSDADRSPEREDEYDSIQEVMTAAAVYAGFLGLRPRPRSLPLLRQD